MRCPNCGASGYSRQTKTPEWRCRKCGHEWDVLPPGAWQGERVPWGSYYTASAIAARTKPEEPAVESESKWHEWPLWQKIAIAPVLIVLYAFLAVGAAAGAALMAAGFLVFILPFIGIALILFWVLIGILKG